MGYLRDRMEQELEVRGYEESTRCIYVHWMREFARYLRRTPEQASVDEIRMFQRSMMHRGLSTSACNQIAAALRFFFKFVVGTTVDIQDIPYQKQRSKLPEVLDGPEVLGLLDAVERQPFRALLATTYAGGLRLGEARRRECSPWSPVRERRPARHRRLALSGPSSGSSPGWPAVHRRWAQSGPRQLSASDGALSWSAPLRRRSDVRHGPTYQHPWLTSTQTVASQGMRTLISETRISVLPETARPSPAGHQRASSL